MPPGFPTVLRSELWVYFGKDVGWLPVISLYGTLKEKEEQYRKTGHCICRVKKQANERKQL